jgi:hypothetical protein
MGIRRKITASALIAVGLALGTGVSADAATTQTVKIVRYKNCTALNKAYRHGVGRKGAHDKVSGRTKPVKNFYVNTRLYNANTKLDRDRDGIACEKR